MKKMEFNEKYEIDSMAKDPEKIQLSKDAYAICEMIDELTKKIEAARISMKHG